MIALTAHYAQGDKTAMGDYIIGALLVVCQALMLIGFAWFLLPGFSASALSIAERIKKRNKGAAAMDKSSSSKNKNVTALEMTAVGAVAAGMIMQDENVDIGGDDDGDSFSSMNPLISSN